MGERERVSCANNSDRSDDRDRTGGRSNEVNPTNSIYYVSSSSAGGHGRGRGRRPTALNNWSPLSLALLRLGVGLKLVMNV